MHKKSYVVAGVVFINALAFFLSAPSVDAAPQNIEATGEYLIGDGPDENINTAKEGAYRSDACSSGEGWRVCRELLEDKRTGLDSR